MARVNWHFGGSPADADGAANRLSHVCEAHDHAREEADLLEGVLAPMLAATGLAGGDDARILLIELDPARASFTAVLTDRNRARQEPDVYRLVLGDWVPRADATDGDDDVRREARMRAVVRATLGRQSLNPTIEYLTSRGIALFMAIAGSSAEWQALDTRPAPVNVVQLRTRRGDH
ncbi:MAG: hypothetical protein WCJ30_15120 [Deltaproteobacteria bacterium]